MRNWIIGTVLIIAGIPLSFVLSFIGCPQRVSFLAWFVLPLCGFIIQMYAAFSMKFSFEREFKKQRGKHQAVMEEAKKLPPEQAIQLLLGKSR